METIANHRVRCAYNTCCIRCGRLEKEYIILGVIPLCDSCYETVFLREGASLEELADQYSYWLSEYLKDEEEKSESNT